MSDETPNFRINITSEGRWWTIHLSGELDVAQTTVLADAAEAMRECSLSPVRFDLSALTFVDVAGYRALLDAMAVIEGSGAEAQISRLSPAVRRIQSFWCLAAA